MVTGVRVLVISSDAASIQNAHQQIHPSASARLATLETLLQAVKTLMSAEIPHVVPVLFASMKMEDTNVNALQVPRVIPMCLDAPELPQLEEVNAPRMMNAPDNLPAKDLDAPTLALACHVGMMLSVFRKPMLRGVDARVDLKKTQLANVSLNAWACHAVKMLSALYLKKDLCVCAMQA
jgi:hypothetical protein